MLKYTLKRLWQTIPTTLGVLLLSFVLFNVIGGSPAESLLGKNATKEAIAAFNAKWGYDRPLYEQFFRFVTDVFSGNLGYSVEYQENVVDVLARGVWPSLSLTVPILLGGVVLAIFLALLAASYRGRLADKAVLLFSTVFMSVNYVVWVLAGQFFLAYKAEIFPVWGYESATYLILPVLIGIFSSLGADVRFFRAAILDEIFRPYVLAVRAKGVPGFFVMTRHVLRNSLVPIVTYVSLSIPYLFTGSLLLEGFFGIPGLGSVSINAIHSSDMAVVRAVVVIGALLYQFVNLATDLLYAFLDPRVRLDL
ncbi:MAG: ABC transporter permease [Kiritimatiellae bacterium]|jgi:peptide/nickel transport system permease protein|nr:ABC transporter permease [Kiritimatiellia bacterium]